MKRHSYYGLAASVALSFTSLLTAAGVARATGPIGIQQNSSICSSALRVASTTGSGSIDTIAASGPSLSSPVISAKNTVSVSDTLTFSGWSATSDYKEPAPVCVVSDGHVLSSASVTRDLPREDVGKARKNIKLNRAGFSIKISAAALGVGTHEVSIGVVDGSQITLLQMTTIIVK